jgi:biopolymer transport protein ExbD
MLRKSKTGPVELPTSSSADIAFLLLSFFLMTTVIENDKGLSLVLPEWRDEPIPTQIRERNVYNILINSQDQVMVEGEIVASLDGLRPMIRTFLLNQGSDEGMSESPEVAVVSLKTDRRTSHKMFVAALDEIQGAYYEIYAAKVGLTTEAYRRLDIGVPEQRQIVERAKKGFPMNISIAESALVIR